MHLPCLGALPVAPPWRAAEMSEPRKPGMTSCVWRRHPDSAADRAGPRWTALDPGPTALDSYCRRAAAELRRRLPPTDALDRAGPRDSHPRLARVASRGRLGQMCKVLDRAGVLRGLRTKRPLFLTFPHFSSLFSFLKRGLAAVPPNLSTMVRNWSFPVRTFPPRAMVGHFGGAPRARFCLGFALIMPVYWGVF